MAKRKKKVKPAVMLYREVESIYTIEGEKLASLTKFPEGFKLEGVHTTCKGRYVTIVGVKQTSEKKENVTIVTNETVEVKVTEKQARKLFGFSKNERVSEVEKDYDAIRVFTTESYEGPFKK